MHKKALSQRWYRQCHGSADIVNDFNQMQKYSRIQQNYCLAILPSVSNDIKGLH